MSTPFEFSSKNLEQFHEILKRYPQKRAALLPTLHLAQEQAGFVSPEVEEYVAGLLDIPIVDVREVTSFYTLFSEKPLGEHHIRLCESLSCWVRGCEQIKEHLGEKLGIAPGGVSDDGKVSWEAVPDCMGACEIAPMLQLDNYFEGDLTREKIDELLKRLN